MSDKTPQQYIQEWLGGSAAPVLATFGTASTDPTHAIDSVAGAADVGMAVLAKRVDYGSVGTITPANGDYTRLQVDELGRLHVAIGPYDPISRIPVFIDYAHHQVHEGETYSVVQLIGTVANDANKDYRITTGSVTPTTRTPHWVHEVIADSSSEVYFYEASTGGTVTGGTAMTVQNRNRNSTNVAVTAVYENPSVTATGALLWVGMLTGSKNAVGSSDRSLDEWDLKPSATYLLRVTSRNAQGSKVVVRMNWYEDLGV